MSKATGNIILTVLTNESLEAIILQRSSLPSPIDHIGNVYKLKMQPEVTRYYHIAAGFPTKFTSIKAIENDQYLSWP